MSFRPFPTSTALMDTHDGHPSIGGDLHSMHSLIGDLFGCDDLQLVKYRAYMNNVLMQDGISKTTRDRFADHFGCLMCVPIAYVNP